MDDLDVRYRSVLDLHGISFLGGRGFAIKFYIVPPERQEEWFENSCFLRHTSAVPLRTYRGKTDNATMPDLRIGHRSIHELRKDANRQRVFKP